MPQEADKDHEWKPNVPWTTDLAVVQDHEARDNTFVDDTWVNNAVWEISAKISHYLVMLEQLFLPCSNDQCGLSMAR